MTPEILFQDEALLVCVKPAGVDSEAGLPAALGLPELKPVHRLDAAVGGVMVYAKTREAAARLTAAMGTGRFEKTYLVLCAGVPAPAEGEMRDLLFRDARQNRSFVVTRPRKGVREAALRYRVLESREGVSLVAVRLETGRSHQIRVQFASRRHPLLGDGRYGSRVKCPGVALWAWRLAFPHPAGGETAAFSRLPPATYPWTLFELGESHGELSTDAEL